MFEIPQPAQDGLVDADERRVVGERDTPPPRDTTRRLRIQPELRCEPERIHETFIQRDRDGECPQTNEVAGTGRVDLLGLAASDGSDDRDDVVERHRPNPPVRSDGSVRWQVGDDESEVVIGVFGHGPHDAQLQPRWGRSAPEYDRETRPPVRPQR